MNTLKAKFISFEQGFQDFMGLHGWKIRKTVMQQTLAFTILTMFLFSFMGCASVSKHTQLIEAAYRGNIQLVKALLNKGADVNARVDTGETPLMLASYAGNSDIVKMLLDNGANVNARRDNGATALYAASQAGHYNIVKMLLDKGANVNVRTNIGATPLLVASQHGYIDIVKVLLESGADVNGKANNGDTALVVALRKGHTSVAKALEEAGAANRQNIEYNQGISTGINGNFQDAQDLLVKAVEFDTRSKADDTFSFIGLIVAEDVLRDRITKEVGSALCSALQFLPYLGSSKEMDRAFIKVGIDNSRRAIGLDPNYATAHLILGFSYVANGDSEPAIAACKKAVSVDPNLAMAHAFLSSFYRAQKKHELSDIHLNKALQLINLGTEVPDYLLQRLKNAGLLKASKKGDVRHFEFRPDQANAQWATIEKLQRLLKEQRYDLVPECFSSGRYREEVTTALKENPDKWAKDYTRTEEQMSKERKRFLKGELPMSFRYENNEWKINER